MFKNIIGGFKKGILNVISSGNGNCIMDMICNKEKETLRILVEQNKVEENFVVQQYNEIHGTNFKSVSQF